MSLTPKQQRLLEYIRSYQERRGYAPTQQEMARRFRLKSLGSIQDYLNSLEEKGYLQREWNGKRALRLVNRTSDKKRSRKRLSLKIPLAGRVAAGSPLEAIEDNELVEVPPSLLGGGENFALKVQGESMIEDGIHDGDVVIVHQQTTAQNGQTVVALLDGEATLKRFRVQEGRIELHPANANFDPLVVKAHQDFQILGVVVGLIRQY